MEQSQDTIQLGVQLAAAAGMILVTVIVHVLGLVGISKLLDLAHDRLRKQAFDARAVFLVGRLGLLLFSLHIFEIALFAGFYLVAGAIAEVEEALYYSASAYATLGWAGDDFPEGWRLLGAVEALAGFVMISWSTAFIVSKTSELRK